MDFALPCEAGHHQAVSSSVENCEAIKSEGRQSSKQIILSCIGTREFFWPEMWRAALTELVATCCILFSVTTSVIACMESYEAEAKLLIPIVGFLIIYLFILVTLPLSGCHVNPTVTFVSALKGSVTLVRAVFYVGAQCLGSTMASLFIKGLMKDTMTEKYFLGGCIINNNGMGVSTGTALAVEFLCTFFVLYVILTVAFDKRRYKELGLAMFCARAAGAYAMAGFLSIMATGRTGYGGAGLNPARCLGPALVVGGPLWHGFWVFWVGPFFAGIVYYCFFLALPREGVMRLDEEQDIVQLIKATCSGRVIEGKI